MERAHEALQQRNEDGPDLPRTNLSAGPGQTSRFVAPHFVSPGRTEGFAQLCRASEPELHLPLQCSFARLSADGRPDAGPLNGTAWNAQNASVGLPQMAWNTSSPPTSLPASTPHRSNSIQVLQSANHNLLLTSSLQSNAVLPIYGSPEWSSRYVER
eukprot:768392-Hanusia_phi.AAC.10